MAVPVITEAGPERLNDIRPLWEGLNRLHASVSPHFKDDFDGYPFSYRKAYLAGKAGQGRLRIFLAETDGEPIGYCVASLDNQMQGEIESIFVIERCRGQGLGDALMRAALGWLDANGAASKSVSVVFGNETAHPFYARYGFLPRSTRLQQR